MPIWFRHHRGSLSDSMATAVVVRSVADLVALVGPGLEQYGHTLTVDEVEVRPYCYDERIAWDTYLVTVHAWGVIGFTSGPLPREAP